MKNLFIEGTVRTPHIFLEADKGKLEFSGRSIPENSIAFYRPVVEWVEDYLINPNEITTIIIKLEYFNTSSSKSLLEIFKKFESTFKSGKKVLVRWFYEQEDEDMQESGEDFRDILKIPFELIVT
ncbi:MAG: DUF1987 domain-containing protein [Cyclobacteriaceae bacterium]|nr:DUF1987 domain-containing protein [Cyclobacteriaceae bacterium]